MPGFELIAPLVMNVLPPAIDYFLCQGGKWQDEEESSFMKVSSTCCSSMLSQNAPDDDDDTIVISSSEAIKLAKKRSSFRRNPRAVSVSSLSLESDEDRNDDEEEKDFMNTSWYCFTAEGLDQDGLSPLFGSAL